LGDTLLGTSGWSYEEWVEPFHRLKKVSKLRFCNKVFRTAEIAYVMETGRITMSGERDELLKSKYAKEAFLGL
jgi:hypothetical protein